MSTKLIKNVYHTNLIQINWYTSMTIWSIFLLWKTTNTLNQSNLNFEMVCFLKPGLFLVSRIKDGIKLNMNFLFSLKKASKWNFQLINYLIVNILCPLNMIVDKVIEYFFQSSLNLHKLDLKLIGLMKILTYLLILGMR